MRASLEDLLADKIHHELGVTVNLVTITKGYWTHNHQDCCRWEAHITMPGGLKVYVQGFDKASECMKKSARLEFVGGTKQCPDEIGIKP